jgi:predicted PurR-regulated permease PerM
MAESRPQISDPFVRRVAIVVATAILVVVLWQLATILLLIFAGLFIAVFLRGLARRSSDLTGLSVRISYLAVVASLTALLGLAAWWIGPPLAAQFDELLRTLPRAVTSLGDLLQSIGIDRSVLDALRTSDQGLSLSTLFSGVTGALTSLAGIVAAVLVVIAVSFYSGLEPDVYRRGVIHLTPKWYRARMGEILDNTAYALWRWTLGQLVAMVAVGAAVFVGLWLLDIALPLPLAVIAGLFEFIPFFGPFASAAVASLVALTQDMNAALYVVALFIGVQQIESNILIPWIQRRTVRLPPVVSVLAITVLAVLFGSLGIIVSGPLATTLMVLVEMVYVRDVLGGRERLPTA